MSYIYNILPIKPLAMIRAFKLLIIILPFLILILGLLFTQRNNLVNIGDKHGAKQVIK